MASPSNPPLDDSERIYLYASNVNVSNFVSVKLSGNNNYRLWKAQLLCLMETNNMRGIVDDKFNGTRSMKIKEQYDSLLKGWIFGSICEDVLDKVIDVGSAKDVWDKLAYFYDSSIYVQQDSAQTKPEAKEETKDKDAVSGEMKTESEDIVTVFIENPGEEVDKKLRMEFKKQLLKASKKRSWWYADYMLLDGCDDVSDAMNSDKNTMLHLAVGLSCDEFVKSLLEAIPKEKEKEVLEMKNVDGSTALHVAAIVGNKYAAELLVEKNNELLTITDNDGNDPLNVAYHNMQFKTFMYLLKAANDYGKTKQVQKNPQDRDDPMTKVGVKVLVNAISAKEYSIASELLEKFPQLAKQNDEVLMALARTFPSELNRWETLIYPSLGDMRERVDKITTRLSSGFEFLREASYDCLLHCDDVLVAIYAIPLVMLFMVYQLILLLILMVHFPFFMVYYFLWKFATKLVVKAYGVNSFVKPIKDIDQKQKEWEEAKKVLVKVCDQVRDPDQLFLYDQPILEAARRNIYQVVDEILVRSPKAIQSEDKNGYDIIQLAVIHRSEKIYSLIYQIPKRKSRYSMFKDSSGNNMLHVAGRLAPSHELKRRTGAALQLQRELQWSEELKTLVSPAYVTEENNFKETPEMVFTREHENLVKEGEKWMKTTAESCSITAALITTIVFAAAITVPGGSSQETGTPLFTNDIAFIIFATSDAISLFTSTTSLLVFLSILTARFAEEDFLVRLPRRLVIGLCTLFISTTAMMVAFSATLFLVFCDKKPWMLAPICGLACFPIVLFVTLQFPLMVDLFRSTYVPIFGKRYQCRFDADEVQGYFPNSHQGKRKAKRSGNKGKEETEAKVEHRSATPHVSG